MTEAGFGADLGAEKFLDIKCRQTGLKPSAVVLVASIRALKMHGGVARDALGREDVAALESGFANLERHLANLRGYGLPVVVAINSFSQDTDGERAKLQALCAREKADVHVCTHFAHGSAGIESLAHAVAKIADAGPAGGAKDFALLYPDDATLAVKIRTVAQKIYGAADISLEASAAAELADFTARGFGHLPVCIAKTQYSFSTDANLRGAPTGHVINVREARLSAGAGFVVAICGDIRTMPGLPREPAAERIGLNAQGQVEGLF